jgi:hypothetical protein
MFSITENKPASEVQITTSTRIDWPDRKDLPTSGEFNSPNRLIAARYPALAANSDKEFQEFWLAYLYTLFAQRASKPDHNISPEYFADIANDWLLERSVPGKTSGKAIIAACIVHAIPYSEPPYVSLGLMLGSRSAPQPSAWKKSLIDGRLPDPIPARPLDRSIGTSHTYSVGVR